MKKEKKYPVQLYRISTAAAMLDMDYKTVRRFVERGLIPCHKLGTSIRINKEDIMDIVVKSRREIKNATN